MIRADPQASLTTPARGASISGLLGAVWQLPRFARGRRGELLRGDGVVRVLEPIDLLQIELFLVKTVQLDPLLDVVEPEGRYLTGRYALPRLHPDISDRAADECRDRGPALVPDDRRTGRVLADPPADEIDGAGRERGPTRSQ